MKRTNLSVGVSHVPRDANLWTDEVEENLKMGAFRRRGSLTADIKRFYEMFPYLKRSPEARPAISRAASNRCFWPLAGPDVQAPLLYSTNRQWVSRPRSSNRSSDIGQIRTVHGVLVEQNRPAGASTGPIVATSWKRPIVFVIGGQSAR